jgi:hypothetical protein
MCGHHINKTLSSTNDSSDSLRPHVAIDNNTLMTPNMWHSAHSLAETQIMLRQAQIVVILLQVDVDCCLGGGCRDEPYTRLTVLLVLHSNSM